MCTGESPRNFPSRPHENDSCAVTPCTAIQDQNKCHFSEGPLRAPLWAIEFLFFRAKGTRRKMTPRKWHLDSLDPFHGSQDYSRGFARGVVSKRVVSADVPPGTKTGTRARSPKPPFWKPPFYLPMTLFGVDKRVVSKRVVSADVPPERKPERGYVRQNHPFYETALLSPSYMKTRDTDRNTPRYCALWYLDPKIHLIWWMSKLANKAILGLKSAPFPGGFKRQFDERHLFHVPTCIPLPSKLSQY